MRCLRGHALLPFLLLIGVPALSCRDRGAPDRPAVQPSAPASSSAPPAASVPTQPTPSASIASDLPRGPRLVALGFAFTQTHREPRFEWRLVEKLNWQASSVGLPPLPPERPVASGACSAGMVLVEGQSLMDSRGQDDSDEVMLAQLEACTQWLTSDRGLNGLCWRFDADKWKQRQARLPRKAMRLCMDRYEFPNARGEFPLVVATYAESARYCEKAGKRLCTESEWTFACEGEEGRPFPYGYERDAEACNTDVLAPGPPDNTFKPRFTEHTARGIDLAWRGRRLGESPRCVSPFGVEDLIGNVDEWTSSVRRYGYQMILKGGHWGAGRHRCRPQTRGHGPYYIRYDQGFRCCQDAPSVANSAD